MPHYRLWLVAAGVALCAECAVLADTVPQPLPFYQTWMDWSLITEDDDWSGVPGIIGYRGDDLVTAPGVDPQTILAHGAATQVDVDANEFSPNTLPPGGLAEFHIVASAVAVSGSDTADAPHVVIALNTTGFRAIDVQYGLGDFDTSRRNAISAMALQYRVGNTGDFTNIPEGFVADASTGPNHGMMTLVAATLPDDADNQREIQVRVITANAVGEDEWIGIANISITGTPIGDCPANIVHVGASRDAVDIDDLLAVVSAWGPCPAPPAACPADIVNAGASASIVDIDDLLAVIAAWGPCP